MNPREVEPLWRAVVGDTEPWRRGRLFLILLAILTFCLQGLTLGLGIVSGDIERVLVTGIFALVFWLQYYFIWIGVHWVRWLNGAWNALAGFVFVIWGFRDGATIAVALGIYLFGVGAYLGLAPAVYFFAKRQRESVRWKEALVIAAVFLLLLGSVGAGIVGLAGYKANLEREAHQFADLAFRSIFTEHDPHFVLDHASNRFLEVAGGREALTSSLQAVTMRMDDVPAIQPARGSLRFWFLFPSHLGSEGEMIAEGKGAHGRIRMHMIVGEAGGAWEIHALRWHSNDFGPVDRPPP
jgi:multisubunit Na+/H+ antiporter MnhG subunit